MAISRSGVLVTLATLTIIAGCCGVENTTTASTAGNCTMKPDPITATQIEALSNNTGAKGLVRAIVTARTGAGCNEAPQILAQAFRDAGCVLVEPVPKTPVIVVECTVDQIRAVASQGLIADIRADQMN